MGNPDAAEDSSEQDSEVLTMVIKSRPPPIIDIDLNIEVPNIDEEVLRKTSQGVVDVNYIDFDDYIWVPPGTLDQDEYDSYP